MTGTRKRNAVRWNASDINALQGKRAGKQYDAFLAAERKALKKAAKPPVVRISLALPPDEEGNPIIFRSQTEVRYAEFLEICRLEGKIVKWQYEAIRLKVADGLTIVIDFFVEEIDRWYFVEVKGEYVREDAKVKLRSAAARYPMFPIYLAQESRGGWQTTRVRSA